MSRYGRHINAPTPVSSKITGREKEMTRADGGGFTFKMDPFDQLLRFLILGTDGGTFYISERKQTERSIGCLEHCVREDAKRVVDMIVDIARDGRAPKTDPWIFAWAYCLKRAPKTEDRQYAASKANDVLSIGTHVFQAAEDVKELGGWGQNTHRAFCNWYLGKSVKDLAYQAVKYQGRNGWTHGDMLRKIRPVPDSDERNAVFQWMLKKPEVEITEDDHQAIWGYHAAHEAQNEAEVIEAIEKYRLTREMIPTEYLNKPAVQEALLQHMPIGAMVRMLGPMTASGLISQGSNAAKKVLEKLQFVDKARVHPLKVLMALRTYQKGCGVRGNLSWRPVSGVINALDRAFITAFKNVRPTGKNYMIGVDTSGSMGGMWGLGSGILKPVEAAAALAMVFVRTEDWTEVYGFNHTLTNLQYTASTSLAEACHKGLDNNWGSTDPGLLVQKAPDNVDCFIVITDSDINTGHQPSQLLRNYRQRTGRNSKMVVIGTEALPYSIADPKDPGMIDIVGFDAGMHDIISMFMEL